MALNIQRSELNEAPQINAKDKLEVSFQKPKKKEDHSGFSTSFDFV
jgi:hypothetical protein